MIQPNELRIGNILNFQGQPDKVNAINSEDNYVDLDGNGRTSLYDEDLQPIPLTPEILEACGFVEENIGLYKRFPFQWNNHLSRFTMTESGDIVKVSTMQTPYLHTLQNVFFFIQGKEIEVTL